MSGERKRHVPQVIPDDCPDAMAHGSLDAKGCCPFCGHKVGPSMPRPRVFPTSDLSEAYGLHYDPDWGVDD